MYARQVGAKCMTPRSYSKTEHSQAGHKAHNSNNDDGDNDNNKNKTNTRISHSASLASYSYVSGSIEPAGVVNSSNQLAMVRHTYTHRGFTHMNQSAKTKNKNKIPKIPLVLFIKAAFDSQSSRRFPRGCHGPPPTPSPRERRPRHKGPPFFLARRGYPASPCPSIGW